MSVFIHVPKTSVLHNYIFFKKNKYIYIIFKYSFGIREGGHGPGHTYIYICVSKKETYIYICIFMNIYIYTNTVFIYTYNIFIFRY